MVPCSCPLAAFLAVALPAAAFLEAAFLEAAYLEVALQDFEELHLRAVALVP